MEEPGSSTDENDVISALFSKPFGCRNLIDKREITKGVGQLPILILEVAREFLDLNGTKTLTSKSRVIWTVLVYSFLLLCMYQGQQIASYPGYQLSLVCTYIWLCTKFGEKQCINW